ncbi:MAG: chitobiase/beta-hexosaminidase C-terminal domain-containing protein [Syntrophothermus sp.]|uniref:OmpL47-type beta-barrel domain-containing protein n=1 Tax=Syntrophothermus sp. TaxID=2736299 RepID=UPI002580C051|nr:chitobiase/beta-hexosaminidase C-terminal domain-containing protein [Syntrophothermus sp.]NSW83806.1 chitobiase/beta-hexosaminidase C-terminal domain-containing protein [Syntrophothermus sp.]
MSNVVSTGRRRALAAGLVAAVFMVVTLIMVVDSGTAQGAPVTGYYGTYYNLPRNHPDMEQNDHNGPYQGLVESTLPLRLTPSGSTCIHQFDWYDDQYKVFSRVDTKIDGSPGSATKASKWWPIPNQLPGDPQYFAVHWEAMLNAPATGTYNFQMGSDDDSWLFIDGNLVLELGNIHPIQYTNGSVYLTKGPHRIDIFFAERHTVESGFVFKFTSPNAPVPVPDVTPPVTTISLNGTAGNNGWYVSDVEVTLNAQDLPGPENVVSGVDRTEYSFDGVNWSTYGGPFTVTNEGSTTVYYRSIDKAGNLEATKEVAIQIDKTPPSVSADVPGGSYSSPRTVTLTASDDVSGVEGIYYTLDNTTPTTSSPKYTGPIDIPASSVLKFMAVDNAGNQSPVSTETYVIMTGNWYIYATKQKDTGNDWTCNQDFSGVTQLSSDTVQTVITLTDTNADGKKDRAQVTVKNAFPGYYNSIVLDVQNIGTTPISMGQVKISGNDSLTIRLLESSSSTIQPKFRKAIGIDFRVNDGTPPGDYSFTVSL